MSGIDRINNKIIPVANRPANQPKAAQSKTQASFEEVLKSVSGQPGISLSKHAQGRMLARNIMLDKGQVERLNLAVEKARQKGVRDTLVLMDDNAFVVNVKTTTIVTATNRQALKERVFTNIDGAVIV